VWVPTRDEYLNRGGRGERRQASFNAADEKLLAEAEVYRRALEKASYGDVGRDYSQALSGLTNYFAGAGPIADSGASVGLRGKLAAQMYGAAQGRTQSGYADYLKQAMNQRQQFRYQQMLQKQQQKAQSGFNPLSFLGAAASFIPGIGPAVGAGLNALGGAGGGAGGGDTYATLY
jgi:hypothetical protein